jgi:hypothetical protein
MYKKGNRASSGQRGKVVSMLTRFRFKQPQNGHGGCNQVRIRSAGGGKKIRNLFDQLTILSLSDSLAPFHPIPGKQSSHQPGKGHCPSAEKKVSMVWYQDPCIASSFHRGQKHCEPFDKVPAILLIQEYLPALYPTDHDVVQHTWYVKAS